MQTEFEFLPILAEGASLEDERGRAFGGRPMTARTPASRPAVRPTHKGPPRKWPGHSRRPRWPGGGGWPFDTVVVEPYGLYAPEPEPEPPPDWDAPQEPGQDEFGWHGETPPTLQATLARLPAAVRPNYVALGPLADALRDPRSDVPGLYLIEFSVAGQPRAYSGQSGNVRRRLQQHLLCAGMLGLPIAAHRAWVAPLAALAPAQRRDIERRIHTDMLARRPGVLTNQRRELEAELLGATWR